MKPRLKGNSICVRLDQRDTGNLLADGKIEDALRFGPGLQFSYAVELGPAPRERPRASYTAGRLTIQVDPRDAREWLDSVRVGFDHLQSVEGYFVRVHIEKDFACIDRPAGEAGDDEHAFPHPSAAAS